MIELPSITLTARVDGHRKKRFEAHAKSTGRSRSFLAADAIKEYLDVNEWQVAGIKSAIQSIDSRGGVAHDDVKAWINSWDGRSEKSRPHPKKS